MPGFARMVERGSVAAAAAAANMSQAMIGNHIHVLENRLGEASVHGGKCEQHSPSAPPMSTWCRIERSRRTSAAACPWPNPAAFGLKVVFISSPYHRGH